MALVGFAVVKLFLCISGFKAWCIEPIPCPWACKYLVMVTWIYWGRKNQTVKKRALRDIWKLTQNFLSVFSAVLRLMFCWDGMEFLIEHSNTVCY